MRSLALTLCLAATAVAAQAQEIEKAHLPRAVEYRLSAIIADPNTRHIADTTTVADTIRGDVVVHKTKLTLKGRIEGQLIVIESDVVFENGAEVLGDVTVIGGDANGLELASIDGTITMYGEGFGPLWANERTYTVNSRTRRVYRDDDRRDWGYSSFNITTGWNYNRVEGLPIEFGPSIETRGDNPTRITAHAIWRTAAGGPFNTQQWGYVVKAEQFIGDDHNFRIGGALSSTINPIEDWQMRPMEASLSTFLAHEDYRDYYKREGWSAFARLTPRNTGLTAQISYNDENHFTQPVRDPWTLFGGDEAWRLQPLVTEGRFRSLNGSVVFDRRDDDNFASNGFFIRADLNRVLNRDVTHGLIDARLYRPVSRNSTLSFRGVLAGSLDNSSLPQQYQHALGGAGALPGYSLFSADCGARSATVLNDGKPYFQSYGCDRVATFSAEYRGGFDIHFGHFGGWSVWEDDDDDTSYNEWNSLDAHPSWVFFFDAGRGSSKNVSTGALYDVGGGIVLGDVGIYAAVPLTGSDRGMKFFLRVGPRF